MDVRRMRSCCAAKSSLGACGSGTMGRRGWAGSSASSGARAVRTSRQSTIAYAHNNGLNSEDMCIVERGVRAEQARTAADTPPNMVVMLGDFNIQADRAEVDDAVPGTDGFGPALCFFLGLLDGDVAWHTGAFQPGAGALLGRERSGHAVGSGAPLIAGKGGVSGHRASVDVGIPRSNAQSGALRSSQCRLCFATWDRRAHSAVGRTRPEVPAVVAEDVGVVGVTRLDGGLSMGPSRESWPYTCRRLAWL